MEIVIRTTRKGWPECHWYERVERVWNWINNKGEKKECSYARPASVSLTVNQDVMLRGKVLSAGRKVVSVAYLLSCYLSFFLYQISIDHLPCGKVLLSCVLGWADNASHPHGIHILLGLIWFRASKLEFYICILPGLWLLTQVQVWRPMINYSKAKAFYLYYLF